MTCIKLDFPYYRGGYCAACGAVRPDNYCPKCGFFAGDKLFLATKPALEKESRICMAYNCPRCGEKVVRSFVDCEADNFQKEVACSCGCPGRIQKITLDSAPALYICPSCKHDVHFESDRQVCKWCLTELELRYTRVTQVFIAPTYS